MAATTSPPTTSATEVVAAFLGALERGEVDAATGLLADDVRYTNVGWPTIRGRRAVERLFDALVTRAGLRVRIHVHHVAEHEGVVLTERTDALGLGRFEQRFWVCGRFEVADGRITVWRDHFDHADFAAGAVRGLLGAVVPGLNRPWPLQPRDGS
jgi:limonene-1,2-epoxide hydrolase